MLENSCTGKPTTDCMLKALLPDTDWRTSMTRVLYRREWRHCAPVEHCKPWSPTTVMEVKWFTLILPWYVQEITVSASLTKSSVKVQKCSIDIDMISVRVMVRFRVRVRVKVKVSVRVRDRVRVFIFPLLYQDDRLKRWWKSNFLNKVPPIYVKYYFLQAI